MARAKSMNGKIVVKWKRKVNSVAWFAKKSKARGCYVCGRVGIDYRRKRRLGWAELVLGAPPAGKPLNRQSVRNQVSVLSHSGVRS
jgi:hypothetical protein